MHIKNDKYFWNIYSIYIFHNRYTILYQKSRILIDNYNSRVYLIIRPILPGLSNMIWTYCTYLFHIVLFTLHTTSYAWVEIVYYSTLLNWNSLILLSLLLVRCVLMLPNSKWQLVYEASKISNQSNSSSLKVLWCKHISKKIISIDI